MGFDLLPALKGEGSPRAVHWFGGKMRSQLVLNALHAEVLNREPGSEDRFNSSDLLDFTAVARALGIW